MQTNTLSHQDNITQEKDTTLHPHFLNRYNISTAFIEELIALESIQDNINYMGEILKSYIAGDYGFNVKITIDGKDIKDEMYQRLLKDYRYIKDEKIRQNIKKYAEANKEDRLKLILACLAMVLGMIFQASQMHYQHNNTQEKKDYSKEKGVGKLKRFLPRKSTIAFNGYSVLIAIPFSMIASKSVGEIIIDVGGGLVATLLGGLAGTKIGKAGWLKMVAPIFGAGFGAFVWTYRSDIQDFITWFNDKQIIEIDIESILETLIDSLDTKSPIPQDPFDMAFALIYEILSTQEPKLRELISQEFHKLVNETPQEMIAGNLTNEEFQSLIVLLCDERCNVNDIHSFLECSSYLSNQQPLESNPAQSNTESTPKESQQTKESTASKTLTPNNNTFPFSLQIKDYNTFAPLSNKQIQITNIDSKQTYTQTTDSRGYVSFTIKESERGDFFKAELVNDSTSMPQAFNLAGEVRIICATHALKISNANNLSIAFLDYKYKIQNFLARFYFYCIAIFLCFSTPLLADSNLLILNPLKVESFEKSQECDITKKGNICEITFRIPLDL